MSVRSAETWHSPVRTETRLMRRPPKLADVRPLPGHYDPTGFADIHPSPQVKLRDTVIGAVWPVIDWPGKESFGPEGREHYGALFIVMKVPGSGWSCWNVEWLHDGERSGTDVYMWDDEGHTNIWQTIQGKMRGQYESPEFTVAGFFVAGIPEFSDRRTGVTWVDVQTGEVLTFEEEPAPVEDPPPPTLPPDGHADALDELRKEVDTKLAALAQSWRMS